MKVLIINHFPLVGSGSGTYVSDIAKNLVAKGHEACIIMPENTTNIIKIEGVKIHPVFFTREEVIENQLDFNFPCMDPHPRSNLLFNNMTDIQIEQYVSAFRKAIEEEIENFKPDVIHTQHIWIISGLLKNYGIPYIITSHGAEFITYGRTHKFDQFGIDAVEGCKKIITISKDNEEEIVKKFPMAKDKLLFVRSGYNPKEFYITDFDKKEVLQSIGINKEFEKIVLFVGRISQMKGLDVLVKAAKLYEKENVATLIAGDGNYKESLKQQINDLNLKNIFFLGNRPHNELNKLYNIADVLALPSRKEALPLVAIESLACGTPAVVTDKTGMEDIITKDVGLTFEMDNEQMLADRINSVLNKKVVFNSQELVNYAKNNYLQENQMRIILKLYEEIRIK